MTPSVSDPAETHRRAEQRLRLLLLGDGSETPGRVRGEESRLQVSVELRRMRSAFHEAFLDSEGGRAEQAEPRAAGLDEELQRIVSSGARTKDARADEIPELVTPADAARVLGMTVGSIYRAVREGDVLAVKLTDKRRGALRIPASELERLLKAAARR